MFNLLTVVSAVEGAFTVAEEVATEFHQLKPYATQFMQAAETAYSGSSTSGSNKFIAVMAALKAVATSIGLSWSQGLEAALAAFINTAKAAFNAFASVITSVAPGTTNALASASQKVSNAASAATNALQSTVAQGA